MKFASIGPLMNQLQFDQFPSEWIHDNLVISPEIPLYNTSGHMVGLKVTPEEMLQKPRRQIQEDIINTACYLYDFFDVDVIQLGGFTTSVTNGGEIFLHQHKYHGYVTHGDSYTTAVTCQAVDMILSIQKRKHGDLDLAIVGAYGIIGEALTKILTPHFHHSYLIGRRMEKLHELKKNFKTDNYDITTELLTQKADVVITATNHPTALLTSGHLKENAIIIDVSQPPNVSREVCTLRPDITRIDGGYVNFPFDTHIPFMEKGKIFACIAEVIMHALENHKHNHVGSIDLNHLEKTKKWGEKYDFTLKELTNFGTSTNPRNK